MTKKTQKPNSTLETHYDAVLVDISKVIDAARSSAVRSVNYIMTAAYWMIGRRIVEEEQEGGVRAEYGEELIKRLAADLSRRYGRGFSIRNVWQMKAFYLSWPNLQTPSAESEERRITQTLPAESLLSKVASAFPLPCLPMCACLLSRMYRLARFMKQRHFAAAGRYGNSTGRSTPSSTNGLLYPETKRP